ncbi:MAG: hypothetical protein IJN92_08590 [Lachnospiraceae bacterium]|nr:hypothetical protein [Lachnospiraceae bacterium]
MTNIPNDPAVQGIDKLISVILDSFFKKKNSLKKQFKKNKLSFFLEITRDILYILVLFFIFGIVQNELQKDIILYNCTESIEYSGGLDFSKYSITYDKPLSSINITPTPYIQVTLSDGTNTFLAVETNSTCNKFPSDNTVIFHMRPNGKELADKLQTDKSICSAKFNIIFCIKEEQPYSTQTLYYLYDENSNFTGVTKEFAEKTTSEANKKHININLVSQPEKIIQEFLSNKDL